jgi:hypothetical protein
MCPIPNGFRDTSISLYSSKIVDKNEILRNVSNTGIYCSSDNYGTVYLVWYTFENSTVNTNALCNSCEDMACCSSVQGTVYCTVKLLYLGNCLEQDTCTHTLFCLEWLILWPFLLEHPVQQSSSSLGLNPLFILSSRLLWSLAQFLHFILWFILWRRK